MAPRNDFSPIRSHQLLPHGPGGGPGQPTIPPARRSHLSTDPVDAGLLPAKGHQTYIHAGRLAAKARGRLGNGYPRGAPAAAAATAGDTATAPANPLPTSAGTTSTFWPGCGAWIISPLPR